MPNDESHWLAAVARASGAAVVLLDRSGEPVAADDSALRSLGADSLDGVRTRLREHAAAIDRLRDASVAGEASEEIAIRGDAGSTTSLRLIALGDTQQWLALVGPRGGAGADERVAFARKLGHDLRGPLNAMVLNLDLLRVSLENGADDVDDVTRGKRDRYVASLHREIGRMSDMLGAAVAQVRSAG